MKVVLTGVLGEKFGKEYHFKGTKPRDVLSALMNLIDGFEQYVRSHNFIMWVDDRNIIDQQLIADYTEDSTLKMGLHVDGAGGNGMFMVILGIVIIAFTWWNPAGWVAGTQMMAYGIGAGIALAGAAQLLMPTAKIQTDQEGNRASYGFGSAVTTTEQGNCVPVAYGKCYIGGFVIGYRITTEDI